MKQQKRISAFAPLIAQIRSLLSTFVLLMALPAHQWSLLRVLLLSCHVCDCLFKALGIASTKFDIVVACNLQATSDLTGSVPGSMQSCALLA